MEHFIIGALVVTSVSLAIMIKRYNTLRDKAGEALSKLEKFKNESEHFAVPPIECNLISLEERATLLEYCFQCPLYRDKVLSDKRQQSEEEQI
jgi:hypothetical protein